MLTQQEIWNCVGQGNTKEWMIRQQWRRKHQPALASTMEHDVDRNVHPVEAQNTHHRHSRHRKNCPRKAVVRRGSSDRDMVGLPPIESNNNMYNNGEHRGSASHSSSSHPKSKLYSRQLLPCDADVGEIVPMTIGRGLSSALCGGTDPSYLIASASESHRLHPNFLMDEDGPGATLYKTTDRTFFRKKDEVKRHLDDVALMARLGVMR